MGLDGVNRERELAGHLRVVLAGRCRPRDPPLLRGQLAEPPPTAASPRYLQLLGGQTGEPHRPPSLRPAHGVGEELPGAGELPATTEEGAVVEERLDVLQPELETLVEGQRGLEMGSGGLTVAVQVRQPGSPGGGRDPRPPAWQPPDAPVQPA